MSISLADYARRQKLKDCPVCQLPEDIRAQLRKGASAKIRRPTQLEWLQSLGHPVTDTQLTAHYSARHDDA